MLIVRKVTFGKVDALFVVNSEFLLEGDVVEELLEPLVGEVDEKLVKAVRVQVLETEDVKHADDARGRKTAGAKQDVLRGTKSK